MEPRGQQSWTRDELAPMMAFAEDRDLLVLSDEIYEKLVYDGREHVSPASSCRRKPAAALSWSTVCRRPTPMTGWRVGYCAGSATLIRAMLLVLQQSSRGPATFVQDAAACAAAARPGVCRRWQQSIRVATRSGRATALERHSRTSKTLVAGGRAVRDGGRELKPRSHLPTRCGASC